MTITIPSFHLRSIGPWLTLTVTAILILVLDALSPKGRQGHASPVIALAGLAVAALQTIGLWGQTGTDFARMVYLDNFAFFFYLIFILGAALTVLVSRQYLEDYGKNMGEYYALLLFATVGMMLMAASAHLIMIFLGLEIMSIAVYVLAGLFREDLRSNEAALKYLILGSFSSAFLLFGMAMLYGASGGTLYLERPAPAPGHRPGHGQPLMLLGLGLLIVGFGFKVASAPFHMWTPDVYEGAPTSVTAFMAVAVKAAAFAAFARVFFLAFPAIQGGLDHGPVGPGRGHHDHRQRGGHRPDQHQTHAGLLLHRPRRLPPGGPGGRQPAGRHEPALLPAGLHPDEPRGLRGGDPGGAQERTATSTSTTTPAWAPSTRSWPPSMALFMFALAGMPPTAGFVGKFYIFSAAIQAGYIWLAIIGVMNSLVSVFYYLRITVLMYMKPAEADLGPVVFSPARTASWPSPPPGCWPSASSRATSTTWP